MTQRITEQKRKTNETDIELTFNLDSSEQIDCRTGIGFFDHMLTAFAKHGGFGLQVKCQGDLEVDDHHTIEDVAIVIGQALNQGLENKAGIERFGDSVVPLDESLVRVVIDISGRPYASVALPFWAPMIGQASTQCLSHFFESFARSAGITLHVDCLKSGNDHHMAEAAFKALGRALKAATRQTGQGIKSTKGVI